MSKTKFYKFYFKGLAKPIIMEAENKDLAFQMLDRLSEKSNTNIDLNLLEDIKLETPLLGISTKKRNGISLTWVGKENSSDGWIETDEYNRIVAQNRK